MRTAIPGILSIAFIAVVCGLSARAVAQSFAIVEPPGGATVENIAVYENGWAWVTFVESLSQIEQNCTALPSGNSASTALIGRKVLWIDIAGTTSGKQLYTTLLLAKQLGSKLASLGIYNPQSTYCQMYVARVAP
jgi:hypothetical protein